MPLPTIDRRPLRDSPQLRDAEVSYALLRLRRVKPGPTLPFPPALYEDIQCLLDEVERLRRGEARAPE